MTRSLTRHWSASKRRLQTYSQAYSYVSDAYPQPVTKPRVPARTSQQQSNADKQALYILMVVELSFQGDD
jgi:hypothetical protein